MYGKRLECPPHAPLFEDYFDMSKDFTAVVCAFNLGEHARKMLAKHPHWTDRQCRNPLYWQGTVRKKLKVLCQNFIGTDQVYTLIPEAMGLDVGATMATVGVFIDFPPIETVWKVAILGVLREAVTDPERPDHCSEKCPFYFSKPIIQGWCKRFREDSKYRKNDYTCLNFDGNGHVRCQQCKDRGGVK